MCDRHKGKTKDYYCLEHDEVICAQCASENHSQTPCDSMTLIKAAKHIGPKVEIGLSELKKLKGISQSILDGKRHDDLLRAIKAVESQLDDFVQYMKRKLSNAKQTIRPFTELTREERWKLKAVATKRIPTGEVAKDGDDADDVKDTVTLLDEVRKQTTAAKECLHSLPNFIEINVNEELMDALKFEGNPVVLTRNGEVEDSEEELNDSTNSFNATQETVYLIEKSSFNLEICTDIAMFEDYIIAAVGDSVQKRDRKRMSFRQGLSLKGADILNILQETKLVAVLQRIGFISVVDTADSLTTLYKIQTDKSYVDIGYLDTIVGGPKCPKMSPVFVVCYNQREDGYLVEYVDTIKPKPIKYPGNPPTYGVDATNVIDNSVGKHMTLFKGITNVCASLKKGILVGTSNGISCVNKSGVLVWTVDLFKTISCILAFRTLVFVALPDERRILTIGKQGHVIEENIIPPGSVVPDRMSAHGDTLMVKNAGEWRWVLFRQMYENTERDQYGTSALQSLDK